MNDDFQSKIYETEYNLVNTEAVAEAMASTNATGWELVALEIKRVYRTGRGANVWFAFTLRGDQDADRTFCGTLITGEALAAIDGDGGVDYKDVTADRAD